MYVEIDKGEHVTSRTAPLTEEKGGESILFEAGVDKSAYLLIFLGALCYFLVWGVASFWTIKAGVSVFLSLFYGYRYFRRVLFLAAYSLCQ